MDSLGNVLELAYYQLGGSVCWGYPMDLVISNTRDVITWGLAPAFFALKVDSAMDPVWAKQFSGDGSIQFLKELPNGDLLAGINMAAAGATVARLDANGNFLWCKSYIRPRGMVHDALIEPDGSMIITGFTDSIASQNPFIAYPTDYHPLLFMLKLNSEGEVQWCRGYDSAPNLWYSQVASRIVRTLDGNYAILATLGYPQNNFFFRPYLMKTDLNGDTLWSSSMGAEGYDYYTQDLLPHSDGSYMIDGGIWGQLPEMQLGAPYLFKTDPNGNFSCSQRYHPVQILDLFPADSNFVLNSIDGATAHPATVSDTIYDPISIYDECLITHIPPRGRSNQIKIYPNPTTGRFTLESDIPLMAESYFSIYDTTGRLFYQRPLPTGTMVEEIDLSRFGKGTFVIKITDPEGIRHERVVLE